MHVISYFCINALLYSLEMCYLTSHKMNRQIAGLLFLVAFNQPLALPLHAQNFTIGVDRMNVAFQGLDNPMTFTIENTKMKDVVLTTDNGTIAIDAQSGGWGHFIYRPVSSGLATINIGIRKKKGIKNIGKYEVRVRELTPPRPILMGKFEGTIPKHELCVAIGPQAMYNYGGAICGSARIYQFTIYISRNNDIIYTKGASDWAGARFDDETREFFKTLQPGDEVWLTGFEIYAADARRRNRDDIKLIVVDR